MAELQLRSHRFRQEREAGWKRLETLLARIEARSPSALSDEELLAIPVLYRAALSSLSVARSTSLDRGVIDYLESLCARAYFFVYGARSTLPQRVARFFARDWPGAIQELWRETLLSFALTALGVAVGYLLVAHDPDWFFAFVPKDLAAGRDPTATAASLAQALHGKGQSDGLSVLATFLFTHNAQIALMAFALGFAFCAPTAMLVAYNGCMLGAFFAIYVAKGLGVDLGGWIFIHGVTELFAIILSGAAGFRIGWTLAFPGALSRAEALSRAGRVAGMAAAGVVVMLFVAGLLEGFARQMIQATEVRYAVAIGTALVWGLYFYWPRGVGGGDDA